MPSSVLDTNVSGFFPFICLVAAAAHLDSSELLEQFLLKNPLLVLQQLKYSVIVSWPGLTVTLKRAKF
jgi:hypothetical protein